MPVIDKVDAFVLAVKLGKSGDKIRQTLVENLINKSLETDKRNNVYSEKIYVSKPNKKMLVRIYNE